VYQKVSQQIVKMVQTYPQVSFQQLMVRITYGESHFLSLILLSPCAESLAVVREPFRHELFDLFSDIVVGGAHSAGCAGVGRGRGRAGEMGFSTRYLSPGVGYWELIVGPVAVTDLCTRFNAIRSTASYRPG
jgi:hypothetical protein